MSIILSLLTITALCLVGITLSPLKDNEYCVSCLTPTTMWANDDYCVSCWEARMYITTITPSDTTPTTMEDNMSEHTPYHEMDELNNYISIDHDHNKAVRENWWSPKHFDGPTSVTPEHDDTYDPEQWVFHAPIMGLILGASGQYNSVTNYLPLVALVVYVLWAVYKANRKSKTNNKENTMTYLPFTTTCPSCGHDVDVNEHFELYGECQPCTLNKENNTMHSNPIPTEWIFNLLSGAQAAVHLHEMETYNESCSRDEAAEEKAAIRNATTIKGVTIQGASFVVHNGALYPNCNPTISDPAPCGGCPACLAARIQA